MFPGSVTDVGIQKCLFTALSLHWFPCSNTNFVTLGIFWIFWKTVLCCFVFKSNRLCVLIGLDSNPKPASHQLCGSGQVNEPSCVFVFSFAKLPTIFVRIIWINICKVLSITAMQQEVANSNSSYSPATQQMVINILLISSYAGKSEYNRIKHLLKQ